MEVEKPFNWEIHLKNYGNVPCRKVIVKLIEIAVESQDIKIEVYQIYLNKILVTKKWQTFGKQDYFIIFCIQQIRKSIIQLMNSNQQFFIYQLAHLVDNIQQYFG
ncbi:unnamed protein product [Paramecium sonneborni]|uniref:Uncharacterized protein n=1 Tax=Paramecium sonneborni TaxID=65129 RepID=A0A8S1PYT5_9CILI|nr:unnamed protein product [Paramecium sonneborni]